jgi:flagellar FliJ protein
MASFLNLKEKLEEQKKLEYGTALAALEAERMKLAELEGELSEKLSEFSQMVKIKIEPDKFALYNMYIELLKQRIVQQKTEVKKAEEFAEQKRLILVEAMRERKSLEIIKEKDYDIFKEEEKRREQRFVDEIVSYRYSDGEAGGNGGTNS